MARVFRICFEAELRWAVNRGEPFDVATGQPMSVLRAQFTGATWWDWALEYVDLKWPTLAPKSRLSMAEALCTVTVQLVKGRTGAPAAKQVRAAMMTWAFVVPRRQAGPPPEEVASAVAWLERTRVPMQSLNDRAVVRGVLTALSLKLDGRPASPTTIARKRAVFYNALALAVEAGKLEEHPMEKVRWRTPKAPEAIDPACVVNPEQAAALLRAVGRVNRPVRKGATPVTGKQLVAFFGCLYYSGLRPGEAQALRRADLELPDEDAAPDQWGLLRLSGSDPEVAATWTDGEKRTRRQLKHRALGEVRPVPCPPQLVTLLRTHLAEHGVAPDGRLYRGPRGGAVKESVYSDVWLLARKDALTAEQEASNLARRPYDLRHSCVSTWLAAGVEPPRIAAWVGHSVAVLYRVYAHVLPGREEWAQEQISRLLMGPEKGS